MDSRIFPEIIEKPIQNGRASYEKKCLFHEKLLHHYLMRKIEGWSVKNFLEIEKIEKYALYAVTDFTTLFIKDLRKNNGKEPEIICDKDASRFCYDVSGYAVVFPEKMLCLYKSEKIKKVIVMSVLHENEIINELVKRGVQLHDIISMVGVLYS